jgi:hypothetical protein
MARMSTFAPVTACSGTFDVPSLRLRILALMAKKLMILKTPVSWDSSKIHRNKKTTTLSVEPLQ